MTVEDTQQPLAGANVMQASNTSRSCTETGYAGSPRPDIVAAAADVFAQAELIVKVKEPQLKECALLGPQHVLFTYLHLAAVPDIARALCQSGCTAIAYETVTDAQGRLPLLQPMSAVAGRLAVQAGATALQKSQGGSGILMSGAAGMPGAKVMVLGVGTAGSNAAEVALGMQAEVTAVDHTPANLARARSALGERLATAEPNAIAELVKDADLVILGGDPLELTSAVQVVIVNGKIVFQREEK